MGAYATLRGSKSGIGLLILRCVVLFSPSPFAAAAIAASLSFCSFACFFRSFRLANADGPAAVCGASGPEVRDLPFKGGIGGIPGLGAGALPSPLPTVASAPSLLFSPSLRSQKRRKCAPPKPLTLRFPSPSFFFFAPPSPSVFALILSNDPNRSAVFLVCCPGALTPVPEFPLTKALSQLAAVEAVPLEAVPALPLVVFFGNDIENFSSSESLLMGLKKLVSAAPSPASIDFDSFPPPIVEAASSKKVVLIFPGCSRRGDPPLRLLTFATNA